MGRKIHLHGGQALKELLSCMRAALDSAASAGIPTAWRAAFDQGADALEAVSHDLVAQGRERSPEHMLLHSVDYLELFSTVVVGWVWLQQAIVARRALDAGSSETAFYEGSCAQPSIGC